MKKIMVAGFLMLVAVLNVGYYNYVEEHGPDSTTFFWKKSLTLQVKFVNPYASWGVNMMCWMTSSNNSLLITVSIGLGSKPISIIQMMRGVVASCKVVGRINERLSVVSLRGSIE